MSNCRKLFKSLAAVIVAMVLFAPRPLLACAACFGRSDSSLAQGMNCGIFTLLGVVVSVLSCFVVFFVHIARRSTPTDDSGNPQ